MATKAKTKKAKAKPALKKKTPPPGKFKRRTMGYQISITENGHEMIHNLNAMTDVALLMWQRGIGATEGMPAEIGAPATIEVWTQAWLSMVQSVEGYEGIEDGQPVTAEGATLIPFFHIDQAVSAVFRSIGVIAGDDQKN